MNLNYFTYKNETITCPKCGWVGKGSELNYGDYSGLHSIVDMDCPKCHEMVGFWQSPTKEEKIEWGKNNPNVDTGWDDK